MAPKRKSSGKSPTRSVTPEKPPAVDAMSKAKPSSVMHDEVSPAIIALKEAFTTPSMTYDATTKRIVPHPRYNVALVQQLARVQGMLLSVLRQAESSSATLTPKQLLFELERGLLYVFTSTCVASNDDPISYVLTDSEAVPHLATLESALAHRDASAKAITATAYVLSQGASATALTSFLDLVQQRLVSELSSDRQQRRPEGSRAALNATRSNLADGAEQIRALQIHFQSITTEAQVARQMPTADPDRLSPEANVVAAHSVANEYYNMLRWLLAVEQDRQTLQNAMLQGSAAAAPSGGITPATDDVEAVVREYDPFEGKIVLERPTPTSRWGLMLNQNGYLVGIENKLRNASDEGGRLYQSLRQHGERRAATGGADGAAATDAMDGLAILQVNRAPIRPVTLTPEEVAARQADILNKLRDALSKDALTLHLRVEKRPQAELATPREVLFDVCQQGGEHTVGQRVVLVLQRPSTQVRWGLDVEFGEAPGEVFLRDFQNSLQLSPEAKNFLFDHRGSLSVVQVNYKNVADLPDGKKGFAALMSTSLLIALQLQVIAPVKRTVVDPALPDGSAEEVADETPQDDEAAEKAPEEEEATEEADQVEEDGKDAVEEMEVDEEQEGLEDNLAEKPAPTVGGDDEFAKVAEAIADQYLIDADAPADGGAIETEALDAVDDGGEEENEERGETRAEEDAQEDLLEGRDWASTTKRTGKKTLQSAASVTAADDDAGHRELLEEYDIDADAPLRDEEEPTHPTQSAAHDTDLEDVMDAMVAQLGKQASPEVAVAAATSKGKRAAVAEGAPHDALLAENLEVEAEVPSKEKRQSRKNADAKKKKSKKGKKAAAKKNKKAGTRRGKPSDEEAVVEEEDADVDTREGDDAVDAQDEPEVEAPADSADPLDDVRDTPLVAHTKDRAEIAIEEAGKSARRRKKQTAETTAGSGEAAEAADLLAPSKPASRVPLTELVESPPLTLNNSVSIDRFDGTALELHRANVQDNWDISVAYNGTDLVLSGINALAQPKLRKHPFAKALQPSPDGRVSWTIESINGKDMFGLDKQAKMNVLKTLKNPITTLRLILKR